VKVNIVRVFAVDYCFGLGDSFKYVNCRFFGLFAYFALTDDCCYLLEISMIALFRHDGYKAKCP